LQVPERYLITSALPYANGPLHVGHIAGAYLPADIYVRYLRKQKRDVLFICGSDEHGAAITIQAKKKIPLLRQLSINIIRLLRLLLKVWELVLIFTTELHLQFTMKHHRSFF
jgi:methionyl-tRNA synthetase